MELAGTTLSAANAGMLSKIITAGIAHATPGLGMRAITFVALMVKLRMHDNMADSEGFFHDFYRSGNVLVIQVLWMVRLRKKEPAFCN